VRRLNLLLLLTPAALALASAIGLALLPAGATEPVRAAFTPSPGGYGQGPFDTVAQTEDSLCLLLRWAVGVLGVHFVGSLLANARGFLGRWPWLLRSIDLLGANFFAQIRQEVAQQQPPAAPPPGVQR